MPDFTVRKVVSSQDYARCVYVRVVVFVIEQQIPIEDEIDAFEDEATYYVGCLDGEPVTTCRYRVLADGQEAKIERVATVSGQRRRGFTQTMLNVAIDDIVALNACRRIRLSAQDHALPFYAKLGFVAQGDGYLEDGIPHHAMVRKLR